MKYIFEIQNINCKITKSHIYFDDTDEEFVKNTYKYLLKNFLPKIINKQLPQITITDQLPQLSVSHSMVTYNNLTLTGTITNNGGSQITNCGFNIYYVIKTNVNTQNVNPQIISSTLNNNTFVEIFDMDANCSNLIGNPQLYIMNYQAFATNNSGTTYTNFYAYNLFIPCLVENTWITLFDGTKKYIQDITYDDLLLVWDFDNSKFASSRPLWIKTAQEINGYYCAIFDDNTELNFVNKHRIFNNTKGKFTNLFNKDNMTTITEDGKNITLVTIDKVEREVKYYNIITSHHMNFYANCILTSCRYNNLYPIKYMKFEKNNEIKHSNNENYDLLPTKYFDGLRLKEQNRNNTIEYINRLIINEKNINGLFKNKKILFLDHGGVMTNNKDFEIKNINYIREIVNNFCLEIVVSSDWTETKTFEEIKILYTKHNINMPIDYTHKKKYKLYPNFPNISYEEIRATEISQWIVNNKYNINEVIIIDDLNLQKYFSQDNFLWITNGLLCDNL